MSTKKKNNKKKKSSQQNKSSISNTTNSSSANVKESQSNTAKENKDSDIANENKSVDIVKKEPVNQDNHKNEDTEQVKEEKNLKVEDNQKKDKNEDNTSKKTENLKPDKNKKEIKNNINTEEFLNDKNNKKAKIISILINLVVILIILMVFSVIFAIIHTSKLTIARGVSIKNINISNLTYDEAREKLEEAFDVVLDVNIEVKYKDYNYTIKSKDISLSYNFKDALDEAYHIGRNENIIKSNYSLILTAVFHKNIDFSYQYDEEELDKIINEIATNIPGIVKQYSYYIEENELIINPGTDGIQVNTEELKKLILDNIFNRNPEELIKNFKNDEIQVPYKNVKADKIDIDKIYSEVYSEPQNAYYTEETETEKFAIYPDVDGIDFAITLEEANTIISEDGLSEYIIPINRKKAEVTINDIGIEAFPYKISEFDTRYDASYYSRSENLKIAASKIDGTVLMPGEQFSFNGVVGERTVAEGYKDAKIFSDGQVVDGLAGGICQISSTLYNAALLANLQIDERYNHSFTTSYIDKGRDATVVYGVKDLKFTNTRNYPIKIDANVANGVASFVIYGIEEENEYDIKIIPQTISTIPYSVQTITDPTLAPGQTAVKQAGASGYKVVTYKETSLNGVVISNEVISNDTYKTMTRIIRVGPDAVPVASDIPAPAEGPIQEPILETPPIQETNPVEEIVPVEE